MKRIVFFNKFENQVQLTNNQLAMKNFNFIQKLIFLFFTFYTITMFSQGPIRLSWTTEVGCQQFDLDPARKDILVSDIQNDICVNVCDRSNVGYSLSGTGLGSTPTTTWSVGGGTITSQNNTSCNVLWGTSGSASLSFTIITSTGITISKTLCIKIKNKPIVGFTISPFNEQNNPPALVVCAGVPVNFVNFSASNNEVVQYDSLWDFGDSTPTSTLAAPVHIFYNPGTYDVSLQITNSCGCSETIKRTIIVNQAGFRINTVSTVCQGQVESYTVDAPVCAVTPGMWTIIGGTKLSETYNTVNVLWNNPSGNLLQNGFGTVTYNPSTCNFACSATTSIQVPVVKLEEPIIGSSNLCTGVQGGYSLPRWPATDFKWKVLYNGIVNPPGIIIAPGDHRNEVYIRALNTFAGGTITLECKYTNTLLHCGGTVSKTINVAQTISVAGPNSLCRYNTGHFNTLSGNSCNWTIKDASGTTVYSATNAYSIDYFFQTVGNYTVIISGNNICSTPLNVSVFATPTPVISLATSTSNPNLSIFTDVCPNTPYSYKVDNPLPGVQYVWSVFNGSFVGSNIGGEVTVKFNSSSPQSISVFRQNLTPLCNSDIVTKPIAMRVINEANAAIKSTPVANSFTVCSSTTAQYKTDYIADSYQWTIDPPELGSIATGATTNQITVNWNNALNAAGSIANLKLKITKCSIVYDVVPRPVTIQYSPTFDIDRINTVTTVCSGNPITFTIQQPNPFLTPTTQITWSVSGSNPVTTGPGVFSYTTIFNSQVTNTTYQTVVASVGLVTGCVGTFVTDPILITVTPGPGAALSANGNAIYCETATPPVPKPIALIATSPSTGITYQWYKNNTLLSGGGITSSTSSLTTAMLNIFGDGMYKVKIFKSGCSTESNTIFVNEDCVPIVPCDITTDLTPTIVYNNLCSSFPNPTVTVTGTPSPLQTSTPTSQSISISGPNYPLTTFIGNTATFTPSQAGIYYANYKVFYANPNGGAPCVFYKTQQIIVPYLPNFTIGVNCTSGSYLLSLADTSTFLATVPLASRTFTYFYSTNNGATFTLLANTPTTPISLVPNTSYIFKLVIQGTYNGVVQPACEKIITFNNPTPAQTIITSESNNTLSPRPIACYNSAVQFSVSPFDSSESYFWDFNDGGATNSSPSPKRVFSTPGYHNVVLTITSQYGCSRTLSVAVMVPEACFNGNPLSSNGNTNFPEVCLGTPVNVHYEPNSDFCVSPTDVTYTLMNGASPAVGFTPNNTGQFWVTSNGSYWIKLARPSVVAGINCVYEATTPVIPAFKTPPSISLTSPGSVCDPSATIGITTNATSMSYTLDGGASITIPNGQNNITLTSLAVGNHTIVVTATLDGCSSQATTTVTVVAPPPPVTISAPVYVCTPTFKATLTATGSGSGTYLWSNGMSGATITVFQGGSYSVSFINSNGCETTAQADVLSPPEEYLWVFPSGNYFKCKTDVSKLIGPSPTVTFGQWNWQKNGLNVLSGTNSIVSPYTATVNGTYNLKLTNAAGSCAATSLPMNLTVGSTNCVQCLSASSVAPTVVANNGPFCSYTVTIPLTASLNNVGPVQATPKTNNAVIGAVTQPTPTSIQFTVYPLSPFTSGILAIQFTGTSNTSNVNGNKCLTNYNSLNLPVCSPPVFREMPTDALGIVKEEKMTIAPNPAKGQVAISYQTNLVPTIEIYDLTGRLVTQHQALSTEATWQLPIDGMPTGIYLVVLKEQDQVVMQKKLIVE